MVSSNIPFLWNPLLQMRRLHDDLGRLSGRHGRPDTGSGGLPRVNLWGGAEGLVLVAELPGLQADAIEVRVLRDTLTLAGEYPEPELAEGARVLRSERPRGRFQRSFRLPFAPDPERVEARCSRGVLEVHLRRPAELEPRKIEVQAEG